MKIGVLALQGAFAEHVQRLRRLDVEPREVRLPQHLEGLDGLIIPGGESTTIGKLMVAWGLRDPLVRLAQDGLAIWGTCAGMIVLAREATGGEPPLLRVMDIRVNRNAFGRQVDSFEAELDIPALGPLPFPAVFIRAPLVESCGAGVEVLARLPYNGTHSGGVVAAQQGNLLVSAFHPELTADDRFHRYFLSLARGRKEKG